MTQQQALAVMKLGHNVFLTGEPGAGKTHTLNAFIAYAKEKGILVGITASTGIAATHIGGMTIHSWSGVGIRDALAEGQIDALARRPDVKSRYKKTRVLIIDEISMLDGKRLDLINEVCKKLKNSEKPFGGMQVILCGDLFQLPPITGFGQQIDFPHLSNAWRELNLKICYLQEQHRQEDKELLELLQAIRAAEDQQLIRDRLSSGNEYWEDDDEITRLYTHNAKVDDLNNHRLQQIDAESKTFTMQSSGRPAAIETLIKSCQAPQKLELKVGAKVLITANNIAEGYVNGTRATVADFVYGKPMVVIDDTNKEIILERTSWKLQDGDKTIGEVSQYPLRLAWAITVHKSQGMSLDSAEIDLSRAFTPGMGYVALSRLRSLKGLYLRGFNDVALQVDASISIFDKHLKEQSKKVAAGLQMIDEDKMLQMHKHVSANLSQQYANYDKDIFEDLRTWRTQEASKQNKPPYLILSDKSLIALAAERPKTNKALKTVHGIGPKKYEDYAADIMAILNQHTGQLL